MSEDAINRAFRKWKNNPRMGFLFFLGGFIPALVFAAGVYMVSKCAVPHQIAGSGIHGITGILGGFIKILAEVYLVTLISVLISQFFVFSGICGCGKLLKENRVDFSESIGCAVRKYPAYIVALFAISIIAAVPFLAYVLLHAPSFAKDLFKFASIAVMFIFIYVPYAIADGYGLIDSFVVSLRCVRNEPVKTLISAVVSFIIGLIIAIAFAVTAVPTVLFTVFAYRSPVELLAIYLIFTLILSIVWAYGIYLISAVVYSTFLDVIGAVKT